MVSMVSQGSVHYVSFHLTSSLPTAMILKSLLPLAFGFSEGRHFFFFCIVFGVSLRKTI